MSNFDGCLHVLNTIIENTVYPGDSDPNTALEIFLETLNFISDHVFMDGNKLSSGEVTTLILLYQNAFDSRFGNGSYMEYVSIESDDDPFYDYNRSESVPFDDGSDYDF